MGDDVVRFMELFHTPLSEWTPSTDFEQYVHEARKYYERTPYAERAAFLAKSINGLSEMNTTAGIATPPVKITFKDEEE